MVDQCRTAGVFRALGTHGTKQKPANPLWPRLPTMRQAIRLAEALDVSVEAVTAWRYPIALTAYPLGTVPDLEGAAREEATNAANRVFGKVWPQYFSLTLAEGNAAKVLMGKSEGAEMLVLGSRGHGGFAGLLLGSVSAECAEHARCPVLVVHTSP